MKECRDCEYFGGYDYGDGTPYCDYRDDYGNCGYEYCPYNDEGKIIKESGNKMEGLNFTVDLGSLNECISETFANTIYNQVKASIDKIISSEYEDKIRELTKTEIENQITKQVESFMNGTITIGGGWNAPKRELTREQYLSEAVEETLNKNLEENKFKSIITSEVKTSIDKFSTALKKDINASIAQIFTTATRATLTENVVQMLMDNDTYKKLQSSMQNLLGN